LLVASPVTDLDAAIAAWLTAQTERGGIMDSHDEEARDNTTDVLEPEGCVPDLDLSEHLKGYWPSSKNVTQ
jgi:hypothetical protein